jgi:hypothetical protein
MKAGSRHLTGGVQLIDLADELDNSIGSKWFGDHPVDACGFHLV